MPWGALRLSMGEAERGALARTEVVCLEREGEEGKEGGRERGRTEREEEGMG